MQEDNNQIVEDSQQNVSESYEEVNFKIEGLQLKIIRGVNLLGTSRNPEEVVNKLLENCNEFFGCVGQLSAQNKLLCISSILRGIRCYRSDGVYQSGPVHVWSVINPLIKPMLEDGWKVEDDEEAEALYVVLSALFKRVDVISDAYKGESNLDNGVADALGTLNKKLSKGCSGLSVVAWVALVVFIVLSVVSMLILFGPAMAITPFLITGAELLANVISMVISSIVAGAAITGNALTVGTLIGSGIGTVVIGATKVCGFFRNSRNRELRKACNVALSKLEEDNKLTKRRGLDQPQDLGEDLTNDQEGSNSDKGIVNPQVESSVAFQSTAN